jgi:2-C-methyl-D-erythritol 4-phosphate cytidylyltransferase
VVAGGAGHRFGARKQFLPLAGRPVAAWSVSAARSIAQGVVLVVPDGEGGEAEVTGVLELGADRVVTGGATRAESVRAGLAAVPEDAAVIVVHDAARPLAGPDLFAAVVEVVLSGDADGAVPVVPVSDTLKRVADGTVWSTVDRDGLVAVQTPQAFAATVLRTAHRSAADATDDAALVERVGATVRTVTGDPRNLKLTSPEDLDLAEALMRVVDR